MPGALSAGCKSRALLHPARVGTDGGPLLAIPFRVEVSIACLIPLLFASWHQAACSLASRYCDFPRPRAPVAIASVGLEEVEIGRRLGEGASGDVSEAIYKGQRVAIKARPRPPARSVASPARVTPGVVGRASGVQGRGQP
jgi:hypothetical protein